MDNLEAPDDNPQNEHHLPFLASTIHKTVPVGYELHQVAVADFRPAALPCNFYFITGVEWVPPPRSPAVYLRSRVQL